MFQSLHYFGEAWSAHDDSSLLTPKRISRDNEHTRLRNPLEFILPALSNFDDWGELAHTVDNAGLRKAAAIKGKRDGNAIEGVEEERQLIGGDGIVQWFQHIHTPFYGNNSD